MRYYIVWYNDEPNKDKDEYTIVHAYSITDAKNMADKMFGEYVISVEPYNP